MGLVLYIILFIGGSSFYWLCRRITWLSLSFRRQDDLGMEKRACHSGGYGDEFSLAGEDLDVLRLRHLRKIYRAAVADQRDLVFVRRDGRDLRQVFAPPPPLRPDALGTPPR